MATILHLLGSNLPTGTTKQIGYLSNGLHELGHVSQFCSVEHTESRKRILRSLLPSVQFCRQSLRFDPTFVIRLAKQIRMTNPDIMHCWGIFHPSLVRMAARLAGSPAEVWSVRSHAEKANLGKLGGVFSIVANANHLIEGMPDRATVIKNGVETSDPPNIVAPLHHELELDSNTQFIAAVGDLRSKKQFTNLTWSLDLLRVIRPNFHLLIVGDGTERNKISAFNRTTSCAAAVHMLGHREDVASILRQSVCFWQASEDEACSNAMLEAMAMSLPIIASDTLGHRELTQGDKYGQLVPLGDCAEFARRTNVLLKNLDVAHAKASDARNYVQECFSIGEMVAQYRAIYESLAARRSSAA